MPTLHVCFLWHMHQPSYVDPASGDVAMPWVRLHGVKDYTDMAALLEGLPDVRVTFNWVPGLLDQLDDAARPEHATRERLLRLMLTPAADLDAHERATLLRWSFSLHHPTMLEPAPRYRSLRDKVDAGDELDVDELRDLQIWFNLAWCGAAVRREPEVAALLARGRDFTEHDKRALLEAQQRALAAVPSRYHDLARAGVVELTCTPYHHPILPLLVDSDLARAADPTTSLPEVRFRWPGDARVQIVRAVDAHAARFGAAPNGMWPSEGALSPEVLPLLRDAGVTWVVSDELLLRKSLGRAELEPIELFAPRSVDGVTVFFRDHGLSDRIGFDYASWRPEEAWTDFTRHLVAIQTALGDADGVVTVALDGENCWEHYPGGSAGFLPGLYAAIAATPGVRLSTFSEAAAAVASRPLPRLAAGSWIDGTLRTWLGDPVKNRAWELLAAARDAVGEPWEVVAARDPVLAELILRAESSDWWWWFGEGHASAFEDEFDALFRGHLAAIYQRAGHPVPADLARPVAASAGPTAPPVSRRPLRQLSPTVDGRRAWYFKWRGAGAVTVVHGAIHRGAGRLRALRYANDDDALTLRADFDLPAVDALAGLHVLLQPNGGRPRPAITLWPLDARTAGVEAAAGDVFEARVPFAAMGAELAAHALRCRVELREPAGRLLESFPPVGWVALELVDATTSGANRW